MGRRFLTVFLSVLGLAAATRGAFEERPSGARSSGLAGAVSPGGDLWTGVAFPASLHALRCLTFGASFSPAPFGLTELARSAAAIAVPDPLAGAVFYASRFGFEAYREHEFGAGLSVAAGPRVRIGVVLRAFLLSIAAYGSATAFGLGAGVSVNLSDDVEWFLHADNLNQPPLGASGDRLPLTVSAAVAYSPTRSLRILALLSREARFPLETRCGIECSPLPFLALRGGFALEPSTIAGGVGLIVRGIRFDYGFREHPALGPTHVVSVECAPGDL